MNWLKKLSQQNEVANLLIGIISGNQNTDSVMMRLDSLGHEFQAQACGMIVPLMTAHPNSVAALSQIQQKYCINNVQENNVQENININPNPAPEMNPEQV